jgi:hypothetical protein
MSSLRFTAYISETEDKGLRDLAAQEGTSVNYIVRCGIRYLLGLDVPSWYIKHIEEQRRHAKVS